MRSCNSTSLFLGHLKVEVYIYDDHEVDEKEQ